ncbi:uncharacterized protein EV422DRAFT_98832 [Fimicolochytrium jonesii]|uniref:uncharacterized protein n=1 Tax=Fimicolochytrium jonesii TaxID=1396493 RepID=UPI0022FE13DB|nr:uncharacterized protein EV422DRAFT_98832 [Fimicolochytrium jonesii]KAI8819608.1 hypothetical protein EV422DRAFT_98832 [Fimicolochytrium jonesii]
MAVAGDGTAVYIFGGMKVVEGRLAFVNTLSKYDPETQLFSELPTTGVNIPYPRINATLTYIPAHPQTASEPCLFLFGGFAYPNTYLNDAYIFSLHSRVWRRLEVTGKAPDAREHHTTVFWASADGKRRWLVVYGGMTVDAAGPDRPKRLGDVAVLDIDSATWIYPEIGGTIPPGRSKHSAVVCGDRMVVYGGQEQQSVPNGVMQRPSDVHILDLDKLCWEALQPVGDDSPSAPPRADHGAALIGNRLYITSGIAPTQGWDGTPSRSPQLLDDMWHLELGPPASPGPLYIDRQTQPRHALCITWGGTTTTPGTTYTVSIRRRTQEMDEWNVVYEGAERRCVVEGVHSGDGSKWEVGPEEEYGVRVEAKVWPATGYESKAVVEGVAYVCLGGKGRCLRLSNHLWPGERLPYLSSCN